MAAPALVLDATRALPQDAARATLVGRAWLPGRISGPVPVVIAGGEVHDLSGVAATSAQLLNAADPAALAASMSGQRRRSIGTVADLLANSAADKRDLRRPFFLCPIDLQAVRACGVTFIASMLERVIEEQAHGDPAQAEAVRKAIGEEIGGQIGSVRPGSPEAMRLKESLIKRGVWSQYLEVGIGPDAEIFTKSQPMSAVGTGAEVGIHPGSAWNNPEPEVVLAIDSNGRVKGAALGNDVNLRDFEGRSALLLGKAKDNNASCAIGPFIRLFDARFGIDDVRQCDLSMRVTGTDGFTMEGASSLAKISRDPLDLTGQAIGKNHQYPDGLVLFLGTMFAPTQDRLGPGQGFTHVVGDVVTVATPRLGRLANRVNHSDQVAPWTYGVTALMRDLGRRGLLA
jgi:fumarylacetoacetate (FAA) hydrolase family protein